MTKKELLFVQPEFPTPGKSINHANFLPIGLLKLISYYRGKGFFIDDSQLVRGNSDDIDFYPKKIYITTLFTYWYQYVKETIEFYNDRFPEAEIYVGGILASLIPEKIKEISNKVTVHQGLDIEVEDFVYKNGTNYDIVDKYNVDYIIVHAMRGCIRNCSFCGTWRIEKRHDYPVEEVINYIQKCSMSGKIEKRKVIFYDNNFLAHKDVTELLQKLKELKINKKNYRYESQSGFDGRILLENKELGKMLYEARFERPKIAWDSRFKDWENIEKQIEILHKAGYAKKEISVFMLYNWEISFEELIAKMKKCWEWKVQVADCRFRPLDSLTDGYDSKKWRTGQKDNEYYVNTKSGWTDTKVRLFRKLVRQQNIMVRQGWEAGQYEQWIKHEKISKEDITGIVWPDDYIKI